MDNNTVKFMDEINSTIDRGYQDIIDNNIEGIRQAVVAEVLALFSKTKFKTIPDLDKKIALFNARITREYKHAQISYKNATLSVKVHDVTLEKNLNYGTSWFDPIDSLNATLSNAVFDYTNRSIY